MVEDKDEKHEYKDDYDPFSRNFVEGHFSESIFLQFDLKFFQAGLIVRVLLGDYDG